MRQRRNKKFMNKWKIGREAAWWSSEVKRLRVVSRSWHESYPSWILNKLLLSPGLLEYGTYSWALVACTCSASRRTAALPIAHNNGYGYIIEQLISAVVLVIHIISNSIYVWRWTSSLLRHITEGDFDCRDVYWTVIKLPQHCFFSL